MPSIPLHLEFSLCALAIVLMAILRLIRTKQCPKKSLLEIFLAVASLDGIIRVISALIASGTSLNDALPPLLFAVVLFGIISIHEEILEDFSWVMQKLFRIK